MGVKKQREAGNTFAKIRLITLLCIISAKCRLLEGENQTEESENARSHKDPETQQQEGRRTAGSAVKDHPLLVTRTLVTATA